MHEQYPYMLLSLKPRRTAATADLKEGWGLHVLDLSQCLSSLKRYSVGLSMGVCGGRKMIFTPVWCYTVRRACLEWKKLVYRTKYFLGRVEFWCLMVLATSVMVQVRREYLQEVALCKDIAVQLKVHDLPEGHYQQYLYISIDYPLLLLPHLRPLPKGGDCVVDKTMAPADWTTAQTAVTGKAELPHKADVCPAILSELQVSPSVEVSVGNWVITEEVTGEYPMAADQ